MQRCGHVRSVGDTRAEGYIADLCIAFQRPAGQASVPPGSPEPSPLLVLPANYTPKEREERECVCGRVRAM